MLAEWHKHTFVNQSSAFWGTLYFLAASCKSATNEGQTDSKSAREVFSVAMMAVTVLVEIGTEN